MKNHKYCKDYRYCHEFHKNGGKKLGCCFPIMTPELSDWFARKDSGEPVGRAPEWECSFYCGPWTENHTYCNTEQYCNKFHENGGKQTGCCFPIMTPRMEEWVSRKDAGEVVGPAPDQACECYLGIWYKKLF